MTPSRGRYVVADIRDFFDSPRAPIGAALSIIGLVLVVLGVAGAVLVGSDGTWTAHRTITPAAPAVVVTSGVVGAVGPALKVTVRRSDGGEVFLGRGISGDVAGLTSGVPQDRLVGVKALHRLVQSPRSGSTALPDVEAADIWRDTSVGRGTHTLEWRPDDESQSLLVATTDGSNLPTLTVDVSWHRGGWFPLAVLLVLLGLVALGSGLHLVTGGHVVHRLLNLLFRIPLPARRHGAHDGNGPTAEGGST